MIIRKFAVGMSVRRGLSILRSLSSTLPRYTRLSSSKSYGVDNEPPRYWVPLAEEMLERKFEDFLREFKAFNGKVDKMQTKQLMGLTFTPGTRVESEDMFMLYEKEFEKLFKKLLSDYKKFMDKSFRTIASEIKSEMQPMALLSVQHMIASVDEQSPPVDLSLVKFEKQFEDFQRKLKEMKDGRVIIQNIVHEIKLEMQLVTMKYSIILEHKSTSDYMKELKNSMNVLRDLYRKLGKSFLEYPDEYHRLHNEWSTSTQKLISVLAFVHWMETGSLLLKSTAEEKMGFEPPEFNLDLDDYLFGLCLMLNDLTDYATRLHDITKNHYSFSTIIAFIKNMEDTLGMLVPPNGKLHEKFDALKHYVRRVEMHHADLFKE